MGSDIAKEEFDERDYPRFRERLEECLAALAHLLDLPGFGVGPATIGAELELFLIDHAARALPRNQAVRAATADSRVTVELDRFNLELNASPIPLAGRPFAALGDELNLLRARTRWSWPARTSRWKGRTPHSRYTFGSIRPTSHAHTTPSNWQAHPRWP